PVHKTTYSTTTVLDFEWDMLPISQEDFHIHELTTINYHGTQSEKRQHLKKGYSSTRWSIQKFSQKEPVNSMTKNSYSHGKKEDTVYPTGLSILQSSRPQVLPPLQT